MRLPGRICHPDRRHDTPWGILRPGNGCSVTKGKTKVKIKEALVVLSVTAALLVAGCGSASSAITNVDSAAFISAAAKPGVVIVDVRTPVEFASGHLPGAVNINLEGPDFAANIANLDKGATYAVYCRSGRRSTLASDEMAAAGFTSVVNLAGAGVADLASSGVTLVAP